MINNIIYLVTTFNPKLTPQFGQEDVSCYVPSYTVNGSTRFVPSLSINLPDDLNGVEYTMIGGLDVNRPNMAVSLKANLGVANVIYSNLENIYITQKSSEKLPGFENWKVTQDHTVIDKFALRYGRVDLTASGKVKGTVRNQFHFDEYKGILRVVTEVWGFDPDKDMTGMDFSSLLQWGLQGGSLYTLDSDLNILAEINGIGKGEYVKSVRFMGDIGYVVTFRQVDPLYSFDLSNPKKPVMLGELEVPGYSRYLHMWEDGKLLGLGVDACDETGIDIGLKLSMFNVLNNEDMSELHAYLIGGDGDDFNKWYYTPIQHDHKAALVAPNKNIIGFPYYSAVTKNWKTTYDKRYAVFSYDKNGFNLLGEIKQIDDKQWRCFQRGVYIGDYIYAIADYMIVSAKLADNGIEEVQRLYL